MRFYLGTHQPSWLRSVDVPLFVSRRRLAPYKHLPRAVGPWALDSGGFSELSLYGRWTIGAPAYAAEVKRYAAEVGRMEWAAIQDWMCEPFILAKTGLSVQEHQARTVGSYLDLMALDASLPWVPVLQGWELRDYINHAEQYCRRGVDLATLPLVGLGSVCRRQHTGILPRIASEMMDVRFHGFGIKLHGMARASDLLSSADSMAWSFAARRRPPLTGCSTHRSCANCPRFALAWYRAALALIARKQDQLSLFGEG